MTAQPKATLEKVLGLLGFEATVDEQQIEDGLLLDIKCEDSGRLIGRQGQTLADLQYIVNRIIFQQDATAPRVTVDVGGYRTQARDALIVRAKEAAEKVIKHLMQKRPNDWVKLEKKYDPSGAYRKRFEAL